MRVRRRPGDRLVVGGAVLFALGLAVAVAWVAAALVDAVGVDGVPRPLTWLLVLVPAGVTLALVGLVSAARDARRQSPAERHAAES
jgi:hypothetical protein